MIKIDKNFYTLMIAGAIEDEELPGIKDEEAVKLIGESIDETVKFYEDTFGEIEDWEVFEDDLLADAKKKLGVQ